MPAWMRVAVIAIWTVCIYGILGGAFVYREDLPSGLYNRYMIVMYKSLPPPPRGPAYCDFLSVQPVALALPCNFKPPFIGWLQGGRY
jgi:hypothetical protein